MQGKRQQRPHATYRLTWYDWEWNEVGKTATPVSASAMIEAVEDWNRRCQQEARIDSLIIADTSLPMHLAVEVVYV